MSWLAQYVPGSFRGVPFVTRSHNAPIGRRGETHEYPYRDKPWFEDLGRKGRAWSLSAFVIGANYRTARDALVAALEAPGPGTLVHPFLGTFQAQVVGCNLSESTEEGGMARFDLAFVEPGITVAAIATPDTQAASEQAAKKVKASAIARFKAAFTTYSEPAFMIVGSGATLGSIASAAGILGASLGGSGTALSTLTAGISTLHEASALIGQAQAIGEAMMDVVGALGVLGDQPSAQIAALQSILATTVAMPIGTGTTAARIQLAANNQASIDLTVAATAVAMANTVPGISFVSYDDAANLRDQLAGVLDDQSAAANDRGNTPLAHDLDELRRVIVADITARGGSLVPLITYLPATVRPAVTIAWSAYGDPVNVLSQEAEIIARNNLMHPLFVPATPLQLLSAGGSNGG